MVLDKKGISYISVLLVMIFAFTTAAAATTGGDTGLTLENAQRQAVDNSRQSAIDDLDIKAKETALKNAQDDAAMLGDAYGQEAVLNNRITREVKPMQAASALEIAKRTKQDNIASLKLAVYTAFQDILLARKEYDTKSRELELAKDKLEIVNAKYAAGTFTEDDVRSAQYDMDSRTQALDNVQDELKNYDIQLRNLLNLPLDGDMLKVDGDLAMESFYDVDISKIVAAYTDTDTGVYTKSEALRAAQKTMDLTAGVYKAGDQTYDDNNVSLAEAQRDYDDAVRSREVDLRNTWNDILTLKEGAELAGKYADLQKKKLDTAKIKYDSGALSKGDWMTAEENWLDAVYAQYKAIHDYNVKITGFRSETRLVEAGNA